MRIYSNPKRQKDPYSLPNVEVWSAKTVTWTCCDTEADAEAERCPTCDRADRGHPEPTGHVRYFYAYGFPGCLNDSEPFGPFETEAAAIEDAQSNDESDDEDEV